MKPKPAQSSSPASAVTSEIRKSNYQGWTVLVIVMLLGFIIASVIYQEGGWLFGEADWFLIDHLSDRSFFSKVICPHSHDAGQYQAREFSHVLEYIDAHFIYWSVTQKMPHFYSVMNFVLLFIISVAFWRNVTKYLKMDPAVAVLLLGLFWTTPCIFLSGVHVRTAKQGATFVCFFLIWFLIKRIAFPKQPATGADDKAGPGTGYKVLLWVQTFLLGLSLCWMDRQGFFLVAAILLTLLAFSVGPRIPHPAIFISALAVAMVAHSIYNYKIGPPLIRQLTGFEVSFEYQKLPWDKFFKTPFTFLWQGLVLLLNNVRYLFANLTGGLTVFLLAGMIWLYAKTRPQFVPGSRGPGSLEFKTFFGWLLAGWVALIIVLNALMVLRHDPLYWPDVRAYYYWIPTTMLVLLAVGFAVHLFIQSALIPLWLTRLLLLAAVFSNATSIPEHNLITRSGHMRGYMSGTPFLLKAMKALYENPPGPAPTGKYDTAVSSHYEDFGHVIKNPLANPQLTADEFVNSSNFYQWLRSKRNLDFKQW